MNEIFSADVKIPTYSGHAFGTLNYKSNKTSSVAILLLSDSGLRDRDGNAGDYCNSNSMKYLAEDLARFGIPVLRYDKRGVGGSEESLFSPSELRFDDYIEDAVHTVQYMRNQLRFERVIIVGLGEGALVGMMASQMCAVDGFVSLNARSDNMADYLFGRLKTQLTPKLLIQANTIITQLKDGCFVDVIPTAFEDLFSENSQHYLMSLFALEPKHEIQKLKMPVLIVQGSDDLETRPDDASVLKAYKPDATLLMIEAMNHVLKNVDADSDCQLDLYKNPNLPITKVLVKNIMGFVGKVLRGGSLKPSVHTRTAA